MAKIFYETPKRTLSYCALGVQIIAIIFALLALICSTQGIWVGSLARNILWWVAFGFLAFGVVLEYISNYKKVGSSRIIAFASIGGLIAALLLVVSTVLRMVIR